MENNLVKAFVGKNAEDICNKMVKNGSFNIGAFFFMGFYFLYRKMYLIGGILVALMMLIPINIDKVVYFIINIAFHIMCGFLFYPIYRNYTESKMKKIYQNNTSQEEMYNLCQKTGGTSLSAALIPVVIIVVILIVSGMGFSIFWGGSYISNNRLVGTWKDEAKGMYLVVNPNNTVELYTADKTQLYVKGKYTLEQDKKNELGDEYIMTITTNNRVLNGITYTDLYTTKFSMVTGDYKTMVMMNVLTYTMYDLKKIE